MHAVGGVAALKGGIRSDEQDEIAGLDVPEMGVLAYPDFIGMHETYGSESTSGQDKSPTSV